MTKDEALKLARTALGVQLDALLGKAGHLRNDDRRRYAENGINAIDEALAQPEQEPVAWRDAAIRLGEELSSVGPDGYYNMSARQWLDWSMEQKPRGKNSLPPQRKPLTENEIKHLWYEACQTSLELTSQLIVHLARNIEAAHGIKGGI